MRIATWILPKHWKPFNRRVDLLTKRSIRNKYFRTEVEHTAQVIYEDANQKNGCLMR